MRYLGCTIALIVLGFIPAKAQYRQNDRGVSSKEGLSFYSNPEYKFSERPFTQRSPQKLESPTLKAQVKRLSPDQMPNLLPKGIFLSRNLIPDNTTQYSLIITDPSKIRISKELQEKMKD